MTILIVGLVIFFFTHSLGILGIKSRIINQFGVSMYRMGHAFFATIGLILIIIGYGTYRNQSWQQLWFPPHGMTHLTIFLMIFAMIALMGFIFPGEIKRRLGHPLLAAVTIWAVAHLFSNGDLGSILLFGSFLAWAVADQIYLRRSNPPVSPAIAGWRSNDWLALSFGIGLWAIFGFILHPILIGVSVLK